MQQKGKRAEEGERDLGYWNRKTGKSQKVRRENLRNYEQATRERKIIKRKKTLKEKRGRKRRENCLM